MPRRLRAQEPVSTYVADEDRRPAKLFANGRSQAIRLPKEFRMPGDRVWIHREGQRLVIEPEETPGLDANGWPLDLWNRIDALGDADDVPVIEAMPVGFDEVEVTDTDGDDLA